MKAIAGFAAAAITTAAVLGAGCGERNAALVLTVGASRHYSVGDFTEGDDCPPRLTRVVISADTKTVAAVTLGRPTFHPDYPGHPILGGACRSTGAVKLPRRGFYTLHVEGVVGELTASYDELAARGFSWNVTVPR